MGIPIRGINGRSCAELQRSGSNAARLTVMAVGREQYRKTEEELKAMKKSMYDGCKTVDDKC